MKTNNSFFSPNRLVFMGGPEAPKPVAEQADKKPDLSKTDARMNLLSQAWTELNNMQLAAKPDKKKIDKLQKAYDKAMTAEFSSEKAAQKAAQELFARLNEITLPVESKPAVDEAVARQDVDQGRNSAREASNKARTDLANAKQAFMSQHEAEIMALRPGQSLTFEHAGKVYRVSPTPGSSSGGQFAANFVEVNRSRS